MFAISMPAERVDDGWMAILNATLQTSRRHFFFTDVRSGMQAKVDQRLSCNVWVCRECEKPYVFV